MKNGPQQQGRGVQGPLGRWWGSTCVLEPGQEDGRLAALVPVPHPVQTEVPPERPRFLRPRVSHQLLQNLLSRTRLLVDPLNRPEEGEMMMEKTGCGKIYLYPEVRQHLARDDFVNLKCFYKYCVVV